MIRDFKLSFIFPGLLLVLGAGFVISSLAFFIEILDCGFSFGLVVVVIIIVIIAIVIIVIVIILY